jgi:hypothetical protein
VTKYLVVLLWPAGLAVIIGLALVPARRNPQQVPAIANTARPRSQSAPGSHKAPGDGFLGAQWAMSLSRMLILIAIGAVVVYGVMALLGVPVVHYGLAVDRPIYNWTASHQVHSWAAVMQRATKIGDTWTCWGAACAAAVCLAVSWRTNRWLPPVVLAAIVVVDHYVTLALRHTFHRLGPPDSPFGTYPSGGCDRVISVYGLIAYLLWREFSGKPQPAIWAGAIVTALGFNEAYSRIYLTMHWFTDALSGLFYGGLLLIVFITAIRLVAGPAPAGQRDGGRCQAQVPAVTTRTTQLTVSLS